jgi:hypothetical protein
MVSFQVLMPSRMIFRNARVRLCASVAMAAMLGGCATGAKSPFALGGVDPTSPVAAEVRAASASPGPYPRFVEIPPVPKDVRTAPAWRAAVLDEMSLKRETEANAAAIPFTLAGTEAWADKTRARVLPEYSQQAPADARAQAEAFAAQQAARATPPPAPK